MVPVSAELTPRPYLACKRLETPPAHVPLRKGDQRGLETGSG
jgi:hypothetical protein